MSTMIRKQVYIEPRQEARLKSLAARLGLSEAELIRRAIDRLFSAEWTWGRALHPGAWERARALREAWISNGEARSTVRWTREELYGERLDRHGRARPR